MIKAVDIQKSFGDLKVLKGIDLDISKGEVVSIVGASGAGKTTLLHVIGTLDKCDEGKVVVNDIEVGKLNDKQLSLFRNKQIGFVFQFHHLLPEFTALENVMMPSLISGVNSNKARKKAFELLELLGMQHRLDHKPNELSGGEQQRVAVARALVNNPAVVLADEPSGNLDSKSAEDLHSLFFALRDRLNQTFVIVTHNNNLAQMADRTLTIQDGLIIS